MRGEIIVKKEKINFKKINEMIQKYYKFGLLIIPLLPLLPISTTYIADMYKENYSMYYKLPSLYFIVEINSYYWVNRLLGLFWIIWYSKFLIQKIVEPLPPEDKRQYSEKQNCRYKAMIRVMSTIWIAIVIFMIYIVIKLYITGTGYQIKPEKIKQYEIAFLEDGSKKVILSRENPNYYLVVDFEIQEEENLNCKIEKKKCKIKKLVLKTKDYHDLPIVKVKKINWETFDRVGIEKLNKQIS